MAPAKRTNRRTLSSENHEAGDWVCVKLATLVLVALGAISSTLIVVAAGTGYLLHYLILAIDFGSAAMVCVLGFGNALISLLQFAQILVPLIPNHAVVTDENQAENQDADLGDDDESDDGVEAIAEMVTEAVMARMDAMAEFRSHGRRRR